MDKYIKIDERTSRTGGTIAFFFLMLTQIALTGVILYRAYVLNQPDDQFADIVTINFISIFGYAGARLYFGSLLPVLSLKRLLTFYVGLVLVIAIPTTLIYGIPEIKDWANTILPVTLGPAILVGSYALFAHLGAKRLEKDIS